MARRKINKNPAIAGEAERLPELTPQQLEFVNGLLAGKTASDAYRAAYDCSQMQASTVWANASKLRTHTKVATWLRAARVAHLGSATLTLETHLRELERLRELALKTGNIGAAVQAEQLRGKAAGHYVEQYADVSHDPIATLDELAKHDPDLARRLADAHGITWNGDGKAIH
jgi:hypothetical protein